MSYFCSLRPLDSCEKWIIFPQSNLLLKIRRAQPPSPPGKNFAPCNPTGALPLDPPPPCNPFQHLSYHIYQYYCYNMFLFHRLVIGHSQYHSTDTRNTSLGRILQKYRVFHGGRPFWDSTDVFSLNPKRPILPPRYTIYYLFWVPAPWLINILTINKINATQKTVSLNQRNISLIYTIKEKIAVN